jgi:hypothetical protein
MIFGPANIQPVDKVRVILQVGQSNAVGRQDGSRLANTQYNYKGIAAGYPAVRVAQDQYSLTPPNVITYYKDTLSTGDQTTDNGVWQAYEAGVNNRPKTASTIKFFGAELSCATRLHDATGDLVAVVKCAFDDTGLSRSNTTGLPPGNWNNISRDIAMYYYLVRAIRDLKTAYPTLRPQMDAVIWWCGERDGSTGVPTADIITQFGELKRMMDYVISGLFVQEEGKKHIWNICKLDFNRSAGEANVNAGYEAFAAANADTYFIDTTPYPQSDELSGPEAAPVAVGAPNANGWDDDNHASYIAQLAVGELAFANIQAAGLIP